MPAPQQCRPVIQRRGGREQPLVAAVAVPGARTSRPDRQCREALFAGFAGHFTLCPAGSEAHDLRNTGFNILKCTIVGQRLDFDVVDYSKQARRLNRANGNLVYMAMIVLRR